MLISRAQKFLFVLIALNISYSQDNEIGLIFGGTNYIGDVGPTTYINPFNNQNLSESQKNSMGHAFGIIYKKNLNNRIILRSSARILKINSSDFWKGSSNYRKQRGFYFTNNIEEVELGVEFNFLDFDISSETGRVKLNFSA